MRPFVLNAEEEANKPEGMVTIKANGKEFEGMTFRIQVSPMATAETADWQFVALLRIHRVYNLFDECRCSRTATLHSSFIGMRK